MYCTSYIHFLYEREITLGDKVYTFRTIILISIKEFKQTPQIFPFISYRIDSFEGIYSNYNKKEWNFKKKCKHEINHTLSTCLSFQQDKS